jgi:putative ABC transport system substrate-binding protein
MKLRTGAFLVTLALGILSTLLAADAQKPAKLVRIGILCGESCDTSPYKAFRQRLRELGYLEGQNTAIEERAAEGRVERLSALAAELLGLRVDIMLTAGGTEAALAVKGATRTLPVVFVIAADPVGVGLVASFARPGGNITGLASMNAELDAKRLELLKEAVPGITRVAVLSNPVDPAAEAAWTAQEAAARALGVQLQRWRCRVQTTSSVHSEPLRQGVPKRSPCLPPQGSLALAAYTYQGSPRSRLRHDCQRSPMRGSLPRRVAS